MGFAEVILILFAFAYVSVILTFQILLMIRAWIKFDDSEQYDNDFNPTVSVLIPAYNEEKSIVSCIKSVLNQTYKSEVVFINDGSTDSTLQLVQDEFGNNEWVKIVDKENGGKFDALNKGIEVCKGEWFLAVDADSFLSPKALETIIRKKRKDAVAVTTSIGMINGCKVEDGKLKVNKVSSNPLVISQMIEYLRTFVMLKMSLDDKNGVGVISGVCGFFNKEFVKEIGGYKEDITEDAEITLRIHENGGNIQFVSDILSFTEAPSNVTQLHKQRMRWIRGLLGNMRDYRKKESTPTIKRFLLPYFLISDYILPWFEVIGWVSLIVGSIFFGVSVPILLASLGTFYTLYLLNTVILFLVAYKKIDFGGMKGKWKVVLTGLFDFLYYRPVILFFVLKAQLMELFGLKKGWSKIRRKGF